MKLRNKQTGETGYYLHTHRDHKTGVLKVAVLKDGVPFSEFKPYEPIYDYDSLAELNEEWGDYEEPKEHWYINFIGGIEKTDRDENDEPGRAMIEIGNYFETKEEAEKAVEKLKAWKRLKDKGFRFIDHIDRDCGQGITRYEWDGYINGEDLDLLFGGEE